MVAAASQGLGFAIAQALAAEGARVSIAARQPETIGAAAARIAQQTKLIRRSGQKFGFLIRRVGELIAPLTSFTLLFQ